MKRLALLSLVLFSVAGCGTVHSVTGGLLGDERTSFEAPGDARLIGQMDSYRTAEDDTLPDLARRFEVGFVELRAANPDVDIWLPGRGEKVLIPSAHILPEATREGVVVNLPEMRLYHFGEDGKVSSFPIGVGREGWATPKGSTRVVRKKEAPTWYPPASIRREQPDLPRAVPPGPENPLGTHAIYLGWPAYLIHGTNEPLGVGRRVSHGCIRMYPEHIKLLYQAVDKGTPVMVLEQPIKWTWIEDELWVEAHPTLAQADDIEEDRAIEPVADPELVNTLKGEAAKRDRKLDEDLLTTVIRERRGYPVRVTGREALIPWLSL